PDLLRPNIRLDDVQVNVQTASSKQGSKHEEDPTSSSDDDDPSSSSSSEISSGSSEKSVGERVFASSLSENEPPDTSDGGQQ
ncbi:unnamed protein product, partial [Amoebophrya sp. A25]